MPPMPNSVLALLPFPAHSSLPLTVLREVKAHGVKVHLAVQSMEARAVSTDPLTDFVETQSVTDLSVYPSSEHGGVLANIVETRGVSLILQVGANLLYKQLPHLKLLYPNVRIADLLFNPYGHNWDHFLFENAIDTVIVESNFMADFIRKSTLVPARDIRIVQSGAKLHFDDSGIREKALPFTVGYAGRFSEEKAPLEFIKVAQKLSKKTSAVFKMFGTGPMELEVRGAVKLAALGERFSLEGFAPTAVDALSALDVLVIPSRFDGRPVAIMEAAALGVVTVAAGVGGIPEMIQEGVNGFCITPWNVSDAVDRICLLAQDQVLLNSMKMASRKFARDKFDFDRMIRDYVDVLGNNSVPS